MTTRVTLFSKKKGDVVPFVKLDCGMLNSSIWMDRTAREIFLTALLMAKPKLVRESVPEIAPTKLKHTGWSVPPGMYGHVEAASTGIARAAGLDWDNETRKAFERLASPDEDSRTPDFDGRRMVRVDGGYLILNYGRYREKDYTNAERQQRYRERHGMRRARPVKKFTAPTLEETKGYWRSAGLHGDSEQFFDHFENCDWRLSGGRGTKMRDWRLAARNWSRNELRWNGNGNGAGRGGRLARAEAPPGKYDKISKEVKANE